MRGHTNRAVLVILLISQVSVCLAAESSDPDDTSKYLDAVRQFADNVLKYGRDTYGPKHTPLFVDGLNIHTHEPVKWIAPNGDRWILSNLASQQNLFRTLDGLTKITGDPKYKQAAMDAIEYAFANLRTPNGLLHWGGHVAYDALADEMCTGRGTYLHELKIHYPYYELMWQVDSKATKQFIESFWSAHILDWSNLDMNRHGSMDEQLENAWKHNYEGGPVFFESIFSHGLSFNNTGSDLFYAGSMLYKLLGDKEALVWSKRLAYRYIETRDSEIGISGNLYNRSKVDRAQSQFGDDFKGHLVLDGTIFPTSPVTALALALQVRVWICQLILGDLLGPDGTEFSRWALEELTAWGKASYRKGDNSFVPMLTDGTSLLGYTFTKDGYYGPKGTVVHAMEAGPICFWAYALAYRITGDPFMWEMARSIARGNSLGDIGVSPTDQPDFETDIESSDPYALLGFLELYARLQKKPFLKIASRIGDNILSDRFHMGFFVPSKEALYTKFDYVEPLAVLHLDAVINARSGLTTQIWPSRTHFNCQYAGPMQADNRVIYSQTRRTELLTLLRVAAWAGRVDEVETLISKGVDVNAHCKLDSLIFQRVWGAQVGLDTWLEASLTNTTTPLHSAVEKGHKDIVELLIAKGADVNAKNMFDCPPLQYAARHEHRDIIELLVEKGATISNIYLAAHMGDLAKLEAFIQEGVDINALDIPGYAPLHYAVQNGQKEAAELFIAKGADVNVKNRRGQAPLDIAARRGHKDIIELLIAKGADINVKNNNGQTPVDIALIRNRREIVKLLIEKGAEVSSVHLAAYIGDLARVKAFIQEGIDVNTKVRGWTPLHYAAREGHMEIVESLLKNGADVNVKEEYYSRTATEIAMGRNHNEIVELLVSKGADIPPLHLAIYLKDEAKARSLIEGGADVNKQTPYGITSLERAVKAGLKNIVELLIAKGADVNAKDNWNWTPLHSAAYYGNKNMIELLIAKGANVTARDGDDRTPLWYAQDKGHTEIVELLRKHATDLASTTIGPKSVRLSPSGAGGMDEICDLIFDSPASGKQNFGWDPACGDVNGDGYDDLVATAAAWDDGARRGRVYLYYGGQNMDTIPDKTFTGEADGDYFGDGCGIGDVNGDNYADVLVGAPCYSGGAEDGRVYVYYGGPDMDENADLILEGESGGGGYYGIDIGAGDVNKDGYDDVVVTALKMNSGKGRAYLYYGGNPMDATCDLTFDGENANDWFGRTVFLGDGDVNGDHYPDLLIQAKQYPRGKKRGRIYLYYGGDSMDNICDKTFTGENDRDEFGEGNCLIDVDNDGFCDVIIGADHWQAGKKIHGRVYVYWGSKDMDVRADKTFTGEPGAALSVVYGGYFNNDEYGDILIGAWLYNKLSGRAYIYYGDKKTTMDEAADCTLSNDTQKSRFGMRLTAGDVNGDGYDDAIINGVGYNNFRGRIWLFYGGPTKPQPTQEIKSLDEAYLESLRTEVHPKSHPNVSKGVLFRSKVIIGKAGERNLTGDVFTPKKIPRKIRPAIVFLHGGSWIFGSTSQFHHHADYLARKYGFFALSVDYRLSGEAKFPAALQDAKCAIRWIRSHAKKLNIDPERIAICGGSAGAHLSSMVATTAGVKGYEGNGGHQEFPSHVNAVILFNGEFDMWDLVKKKSLIEAMIQFIGGSSEEMPEKYNELSSVKRIHSKVPATLFLHGTIDKCVSHEQSVAFFNRLQEVGVHAELELYEDKPHAWFNREPDRTKTLKRMEKFLVSRFGLGEVENRIKNE